MIRKSALLFILLLCGFVAKAQNVEFTVDGPRVAVVGSYFKIEFKLNEEPDSFEGPDFGDLEVVAGPIQSQMSSYSYSNGKSTSSKSIVYTYGIVAPKEGTYTISPATAVVNGKSYNTKPFPMEIAKERTSQQSSNSGASSEGRSSSSSSRRSFEKDDILLRITVDKKNPYKGESVVATVTLYDRTECIVGVKDVKLPDFNGFWKQELSLDGVKVERETFNGKVYQTQVVGKYLLFPQKSGKITIDKMDLTIIARIIVESPSSGRSMLDSFFGMGVSTQDVSRLISSQSITLDVKELPSGAPIEFDGAVGEFAVEGSFDKDEVNANSGGTYTLRITGAGNMPLISAPKIDLPSTFELYPSKNSEKFDVTSRGVKGYKQFDYPFITRSEGEYDISPYTFAYFDPKSGSYRVVKCADQKVVVLRDNSGSSANSVAAPVSGVTKEELKILGEDIRFISTKDANLERKNTFFVSSPMFYLMLLVQLLMCVASLFYLRKRIREMRDTVRIKNKRANKVALKRLKNANGYMNSGKESLFYQEMLTALLGYVSDKLNIPVSELSKENISQRLLDQGVAEQSSEELLRVISDCEMAQYSPMESSQMGVIYSRGIDVIGRIENKI